MFNSSDSFSDTTAKENIQGHIQFINGQTKFTVIDKSQEYKKLHDLFDPFEKTWFECKADHSAFTDRFLIEYKANVPTDSLGNIPQKQPLAFEKYQDMFCNLPIRFDALATDILNLEPNHFLSYWFSKTNTYYLLDIRDLRNQIDASAYPFIVCGKWNEDWRSVCRMVPIADAKIYATWKPSPKGQTLPNGPS